MPSLNHTHTIVRAKTEGYWKCKHPDCSYFVPRSYIEGKSSLCNGCGEKFVLQMEDFKRSFPKCINCKQTKEAKEFQRKKKILEELGIGI